jgi:hypothetical protein
MASEFCLYGRIINGREDVGSGIAYLHMKGDRCIILEPWGQRYYEEAYELSMAISK